MAHEILLENNLSDFFKIRLGNSTWKLPEKCLFLALVQFICLLTIYLFCFQDLTFNSVNRFHYYLHIIIYFLLISWNWTYLTLHFAI